MYTLNSEIAIAERKLRSFRCQQWSVYTAAS